MMNRGDVGVPVAGGLPAVWCQNGKALGDASGAGAFQYREAVVHHQCCGGLIGFQPGEVLPEGGIFLGFASWWLEMMLSTRLSRPVR